MFSRVKYTRKSMFTAKVTNGGWRAVGVAKDLPIQAAELMAASRNFNTTVTRMHAILESINAAGTGELQDIEKLLYNVCVDSRDKAADM